MWTVPSRVDVPGLSDLPFIRGKYERLLQGKNTPLNNDHEFERDFFLNPISVPFEQATALEMLSAETFAALCAAMEPAYYDKPFRNKEELSAIAAQEFDSLSRLGSGDDQAIFEQVMSFILFKSRASDDVQWHKVAELYNNSQESQQHALAFYFDRCENRDLLDMLSTRAPAFSLPDDLNEDFESRVEGGETQSFDPGLKKWIREDQFANQFEAFVCYKTGGTMLIGTGPSLKNVLAKAISRVRDDQEYDLLNVTIHRFKIQIAEGRIVPANGSDDEAQMIKWPVDDGRHGNSFIKTLYAVEKSLGLQWSKTRRLEDELGM